LLWLVGAAIALLLSCLSKEAGLIFPVCWVAILLLRKNWRSVSRAALIIVFVAATYLSMRLPAEHIPAPTLRAPAPLLVRPIIMARAVAEYTGLLIAPINLHMERDVETYPGARGDNSSARSAWRELETLAGLLLIAGFIYWLVRERKRDRAVFACLVLTAITYLPISGVISLNATIAEHWVYLPSAFLLVAAALCVARGLARERARVAMLRRATLAAVAVWTLFLGARSYARTFDWQDQRSFLERAVANGGGSNRMLINLAGVESNEGQLEQAKAHLQQVLQSDPENPFAVLNAGSVAIKQGDFKTARELLTRATKLPVVDAQAHELLAVLTNKESGKVDLMRLRLAARTGPPDWSIEKRYVKVLDESGATAAAIAELRHCLQMEWYRAESWQLLSQLLAKMGQNAEAAAALEQAHRYDVRLDARPKTV
jgi:tetratricopeptide (TPR) repeat protein